MRHKIKATNTASKLSQIHVGKVSVRWHEVPSCCAPRPHSDAALPSFRSRLPLRLGGSCAAPAALAAGALPRALEQNLNSLTVVAGLACGGRAALLVIGQRACNQT